MKALALVDEPDHVCARYRIRAFEPALGRAGIDLKVAGLALGPLARARQLREASRFDVVLLQRKLLASWQLAILRRSARRLVFDFDDAVMLRDSHSPRGFDDPRRARRFAALMKSADLVLAGNDHLADLAGAARRVVVIPTCVDPNRYRQSAGSGRTDGVDLVWVGSSSTLRGLEREKALFDRLGREIPGLRIRLIADRSADFGALPAVFVPWSEETEADAIAGGDIGIAIVPDDPWSRGKCGLKVLQYQAAGLAVVANPVGVQTRMVEPGISGFLASNDEDWADSIRSLALDPSLRSRMGAAGRAAVGSKYAVDVWSSRFVAAISGVEGKRVPHGRPMALPVAGGGR